MQKLMRMIHKEEKGFTLVELMVVVVIIGILVAIAIPIYNTLQETARLNAHMSNIRTIEGTIAVAQAEGTDSADIDTDLLEGDYFSDDNPWPTSPGTYSVTAGTLTADPTKAATQTAIDGGEAVTWP
jgi:prepilin-type N-terminal cleavage/methylation domain-containing protein